MVAMDVIVTTIYNPSVDIEKMGENLALSLDVPFVDRDKKSLPSLREKYGVTNILVATTGGPVVHTLGGEYFFHLSMAELRIKNLINGKHDHMAEAMNAQAGISILDCTLGLASDAIVASYIAGDQGKIVGLETSPIIALIANYGLKTFVSANEAVTKALRGIEVKNIDYHDYLTALPDKSFDVVFFDPMFRRPVHTSSNFKPLRYLADNRPVTVTSIHHACRVATKRVILKESRYSAEFKRLGFTAFLGGRYSSVQFGVIDVGGCSWNV